MPEYAMTESAPADDAASETAEPKTPMSEEDVSDKMKHMISDAADFIDSEVSPQRKLATDYYQGQPFGNEEEGRSQIVMTELRDVVTGLMPSFMRAFWGPEQRVEFMPLGPEDVAQAEQETDYVNEVVLVQDNPGFLHTYVWMKDALVRGPGVMKWYWEDAPPTHHRIDNVSMEQLNVLMGEEGVDLVGAAPKQTSFMGIPTTLYDVEFTKKNDDGFARFMPVPTEEYIFNRSARSQDEALIVGHRMSRTTSELLALGVSQATIDEHGGHNSNLEFNEEAVARNPAATAQLDAPADAEGENAAPSDRHDYYEMYPKLDVDGDGVAELRKICLLGPDYYVVSNDPADERPFALLTPDPEPHTMLGLTMADYVSDLQRWSSYIVRGINDSLALTLNPRMEVVEDQVSMADVMSSELGTAIRVKQPNVVRPLTIPFVGGEALPILELIQAIKERRVGQSPASLDGNALQSSTKTGVDAQVAASQERVELIARIFAEGGFTDLMKGLRRLIVKHQPRKRMVRLRGKYVEVDPRTWDIDRDVRVNVALGLGFVEDRLNVLGTIASEQKEWIDKLGPDNALVNLGQYRATLARIAKLRGYPNADEFFKPLPLDWQAPPPPPAPPDPAMMVAQAEVQKSQAATQQAQMAFQLKQMEAEAKRQQDAADLAQRAAQAQQQADLEREKLSADITLRTYELELKYKAEIDMARMRADIDLERERMKLSGRLEEARLKADSDERTAVAAAAATPEPKPEPKPAPPQAIHVHLPPPGKRTAKASKDKDGNVVVTSEES